MPRIPFTHALLLILCLAACQDEPSRYEPSRYWALEGNHFHWALATDDGRHRQPIGRRDLSEDVDHDALQDAARRRNSARWHKDMLTHDWDASILLRSQVLSAPVASPDGTHIAFEERWEGYWPGNHPHGKPRKVAGKLVVGRIGAEGLLEYQTLWGEVRPEVVQSFRAISWSPDSKSLFFSCESLRKGGGKSVRSYIIDMRSNAVLEVLGSGFLESAQWSPDGTRLLLYGDYRFSIVALREDGVARSERFLPRLSAEFRQSSAVHSPAWSMDSSRVAFLAVVDKHRTLWLLDADLESVRPVAGGHRVQDFAWSPTQLSIAFSAADPDDPYYQWAELDALGRPAGIASLAKELHLAELDDSSQRLLLKTTARIRAAGLHWSPGGRLLACEMGSEQRGSLTPAKCVCILDTHKSVDSRFQATQASVHGYWLSGWRPVWSTDGRRLSVNETRQDRMVYPVSDAPDALSLLRALGSGKRFEDGLLIRQYVRRQQ